MRWIALVIILFGVGASSYGFTENDLPYDILVNENKTVVEDYKQYEANKTIKNNLYYLYSRNNVLVPQSLTMNAGVVKLSYFNRSLETVVVVHGWLGDLNQELNPVIRDAYLNKKSVNIIIVDWGYAAKLSYVLAVKEVPKVGKNLGEFLAFLSKGTGASMRNMHLVGHSLGAHVVGIAGRYNDGKIARITGLDPAGPSWTNRPDRLSPTDALYVEAIHTNGGKAGNLGIGEPLGRINFYPNGGAKQPGCSTNTCNHSRSWKLFAASVTFDKFVARECSNEAMMMLGVCRGTELNMGNDNLGKTGGKLYYLETKATYPYYK